MARPLRIEFPGALYHVMLALTARAVRRAEDWRWGNLWSRRHGDKQLRSILSDWPVARPRNWVKCVNATMTKKEADGVRVCIARNRPYGAEPWQAEQAEQLGLMHTMRSEGRPKSVQSSN